jgi:hypothetical protein
MKLMILAYGAALTLSLFSNANASTLNLLTNGSFDAPAAAVQFEYDNAGSTQIAGWKVIDNQIARLTTGASGVIAADGNEYLDLTGANDGKSLYGGVAQSLTTIVGATYLLSFEEGNFSANPKSFHGGTTGVMARAGTTQQTFTVGPVASGYVWDTFTMEFIASSTSTLISLIGTDGDLYTGLDNASVTLVSTPVTEPGTWGLMLAGLGLIALLVHQRRVAQR